MFESVPFPISMRHRKKKESKFEIGRGPPRSGFVVYRVSAFLVSQPRETFDSIRPDGISISYRGSNFETLENTVPRMYTRNPFDLRFHANKDRPHVLPLPTFSINQHQSNIFLEENSKTCKHRSQASRSAASRSE